MPGLKESILTACNIKVTGLFIKRKESKIHGAEAGERDSDAVEYVTVREDSDVEIGREYVVEGSNFLISEESVWHPNFAGIRQCQVFDLF